MCQLSVQQSSAERGSHKVKHPFGVGPQLVCSHVLCSNVLWVEDKSILQAPTCLADAGVQPRLITRWREVHGSSRSRDGNASCLEESGRFVSDAQRAFFGFCASWKDILFTQRPYLTRHASVTHRLLKGPRMVSSRFHILQPSHDKPSHQYR